MSAFGLRGVSVFGLGVCLLLFRGVSAFGPGDIS